MLAAIQKETILVKGSNDINYISTNAFPQDEPQEVIETIYFGGGTPSLLDVDEIKMLLRVTNEFYQVKDNAEITLEVNPDDINEIKLRELKKAGINRLSIGIQSFKETDLQWMNRGHNAEQALQCITLVNLAGFTNYSVDLIYGTPTLRDEDWKANVEAIIALKVPHVSCYALTVEPSTALQKMISQKKKVDVDPEKQASHFLMLMKWMEAAGYEHYEISNFALPGFRSRHNSSYWQGKPYIGIGPSAHSYFGKTRRSNISNNSLYIKSIESGIVPFEEEVLTVTQQLNEYTMTSLRTMEGVDLNFVREKFGEEASNKLWAESKKFHKSGKLKTVDQHLILTTEGKLFADGIAADLFFEPGYIAIS